MTRRINVPALAAVVLLAAAPIRFAAAAPPGAPPNPVLARVNGEPITLTRIRGESPLAPGEAAKALERMIGVELAIQEGYRMGLQDTVEVRDQLGIFERDTLRDGLFSTRLKALKPDPAQVDALAKSMTVEVRIRSAVFETKEDAGRLVARAARGDDFDAAAAEIAAEGKGRIDPGEGFIPLSELLPAVQEAIAPLRPGGVSGIYRIENRFAVSHLVERRAAPDVEARSKAEAEVLKRMQIEALAKYVDELKNKYAKVDEALLASVDFDAKKPGFESYLKDQRTLVTLSGAEPIRVHDLADAVRKRLFHGAEQAAEKNRLNRKKIEILDDLIAKRVVMKEALAKGLDRKPEYVALRRETEREFVFGVFIARVIEPEIKVTDARIQQYYEAHRKELTQPDMARVESIAFGSPREAEAALAKLRAGADLAWMRSNAPGRLDPKSREDLLDLPTVPVILSDLPAELRQALSKARTGEYRLYSDPQGVTYVILLKELLAGRTIPLEEASPRIRTILTGEERQRAFDEYVGKLRKASDVRVLVTPAQVEKLGTAASAS